MPSGVERTGLVSVAPWLFINISRPIGTDTVIRLTRFWPEPIDERFSKIGTYEIYTIACNLINGLPPSYR
ncbi:hypothetical protein GGD64_007637 [Bradyrhizobium sp. CIR3A]|nr:hypothetical protein [Bradyrhizobium sp. CIR3A]